MTLDNWLGLGLLAMFVPLLKYWKRILNEMKHEIIRPSYYVKSESSLRMSEKSDNIFLHARSLKVKTRYITGDMLFSDVEY